MANSKPTTVTTGEVRISYEHLLTPQVKRQGDAPKFSATLLIPKSDVATKQRIDAAIQAAIAEGASSKWGGVRPPQIPVPIYDGDGVRPSDGMPFGDECKGHWVMSASSKTRQDIVDLNLQPIINATEIYSGMYARVNINFFPYKAEEGGKKGIGCGLGPVQKTRDGEPLAGGVSAEEAFGGAQGGFAPPPQAAPGYSQPVYPQQPYAAPQQPAAPWHTPGYPAQPAAPAYPQQPVVPFPGAPQPPAGINPITGQPYQQAAGGVMGI